MYNTVVKQHLIKPPKLNRHHIVYFQMSDYVTRLIL